MDRWFELRTIAAVARLGTVSAAARELDLHRATVLRHVDLMEASLGMRLFLRHSRGYTPTAAALKLAQVAQNAQLEISHIAASEQAEQNTFSGIVTIAATSLIAQTFMPQLAAELKSATGLFLQCMTGLGFEALEQGKVDIAIRVGAKPDIPEYVVQSLGEIRFGLYGSPAYIARHGRPDSLANLDGHIFAGPLSDGPKVGPYAWLIDNVPDAYMRIRSDDAQLLSTLVLDGHALSTLPTYVATKTQLIDVLVEPGLWSTPLWIVTHRDAHRLHRIQSCLAVIKASVKHKDFMDRVAVEAATQSRSRGR